MGTPIRDIQCHFDVEGVMAEKSVLPCSHRENAPHWEECKRPWNIWIPKSTVMALVEAIKSGGYEAEFFEGDISLVEQLPKYRPDICFNICESHFGDAREAQVPSLLEMMRIPYTGSRVLTLALALDKPMTKRVLTYHDLPTPDFQSFERVDDPLSEGMMFPLFVKPSREGTGMGVSKKSIVRNEQEMRDQIDVLLKKYRQTVLVESYIEGREITVGMVGNLIGPASRRLPNNLESPRIQAGLHFFPPLESSAAVQKPTQSIPSPQVRNGGRSDVSMPGTA